MSKILKVLYLLFCLIFIFYLVLPGYKFPNPPSDALQSDEPGDTESPLRRAYFTNLTREEVMNYYKNQFTHSSFYNLPLPIYRLNYPPEDAQTLIRDQTRSTFLEEIVHPFRESLYVNGFEPKEKKDAINIAGKIWRQKIIVKYVPSLIWVRLLIALPTLILIPLLYLETKKTIILLINRLKNRKK